MTVRAYSSPQAFKQALEQRLKTASLTGADFARRRQLLVFDRFLARAVAVFGDAVLLKGGLVLELRLERARATKDVDLRLTGSPETVLEKLQEAGRHDLGDFMTFEVGRDAEQPTIQNDGMRYEGLRFRAECRLAGRLYGQRFGVDVAFGDPLIGETEIVSAEDILAFAGIPPPRLQLYPLETHIAEKLHAYTMPRARPNTRVKDLPDMALLASIKPLEAQQLRSALIHTFDFRDTHPLPATLPDPSASWLTTYAEIARTNALAWTSLERVTTAVRAFLNPLLAGANGIWSPVTWKWEQSDGT
ncbi:MAG TPA: nucleotidyl transferase AbiEii/AbiGii toxin family protein [Steroidobacteraceae bacterium]|nr:nucleotidyl transferase AbiEii/AbiGii toxin family protein [Steroidobacteraceae bacterium]